MSRLLTILIALMLPLSAARADDVYPSRPIKLVLPFAAGGGTDVVARILAQQLTKQMGVAVIVENRAGANGNIGAEVVARAAPDGYTLLYNTSFIVTNPWLYKSLGYNAEKDFDPILLTARVPLLLVVNPSIPVKTLAEFVEYAKARPGKLSYASSGIGGSTHLANLLLQRAAGIEAVHVAYRGGGPALNDVMAGAVQFYTDTANTAIPQVKAGTVRGLAVTSKKRLPELPDVPTIAETLQPDFEVYSWQGVMAPAKTPAAIIARLQKEFSAALQDPSVRERLAAQTAEPIGSTTAEYIQYLKDERALWGNIIQSANVRLE
ncbi:tripartite-type tricarboxylate transporter receptor subunit TctC [Azorhizobium sp. AG788]|uniref:Bug family tripartite tricarboxylate transporter substrate binding protein n=1 Tax=Azorhizobium sp. AG788 TaxID=2183897 RepID=UPI0010606EB2|nr:tripartite tricarboxylate transporter substrate binding protein [Azorhizobium sp. AG788]TDU00854.1 tripartite-type tricarboxylate transporter receptor subunit TctC [Azorhizobium sp. AG788]